jgi:hypothetical protein
MTLYEELMAALTVGPQKQDQSDDAYITEIVLGVASLPQTNFDMLSKKAQNWYNSCAENQYDITKWPHLEGFKDPVKQEKPKTAPSKPKSAPANAERQHRVRKVREVVMMRPDIGSRQIQKYLDATSCPNISFQVVSVIASETRSFINLARELGLWRDKSVFETGEPPLSKEENDPDWEKEGQEEVASEEATS